MAANFSCSVSGLTHCFVSLQYKQHRNWVKLHNCKLQGWINSSDVRFRWRSQCWTNLLWLLMIYESRLLILPSDNICLFVLHLLGMLKLKYNSIYSDNSYTVYSIVTLNVFFEKFIKLNSQITIFCKTIYYQKCLQYILIGRTTDFVTYLLFSWSQSKNVL